MSSSTYRIYNNHSWFNIPHKLAKRAYYSRKYNETPSDETHTSLNITVEAGKITALYFENWVKHGHVYHLKDFEKENLVAIFEKAKCNLMRYY